MKVKLKKKSSPITEVSAMEEVSKFLKECEAIDSLTRLGTFLCQRYKTLFGTEPPNAMLCMIKAKIAYRLQWVGMKSAGKTPTVGFLKNYEAAQKLNLDGFDTDAKFFMELDIKKESQKTGEVNTMAKVKKKLGTGSATAVAAKPSAVKKEKKESVVHTWERLMAAQPKAKLSDAALAAEMRKAHPEKKKYDELDVALHRSIYNRGKLACQTTAPKVRVEKVGK